MFSRRLKLLALLSILALASSCGTPESYTVIQRVPIGAVTLTDGFLKDRVDLNNEVTIRSCYDRCEETGCIDNFYIAAGLKEGLYRGNGSKDTDVYKTIEAVAYALQSKSYPELKEYTDKLIDVVAAAQEEDGYLNSIAQTLDQTRPPIESRRDASLYFSGHLYEAGVAYYQATGKRTLLDVCIKNADLVCATYGPGKREEPSGHPEIEIGLVKLYKVTGDQKYLDTAKFLLEMRGVSKNGRRLVGVYHQDHKPVLEQEEVVGHAVCANYLFTGMADYAEVSGDTRYIDALEKLWQNVAECKLYVTGGLGAFNDWEAYGDNYSLPNKRAYCESCASIAGMFWCERMFLHKGDAKYIDMLERTLYNAMLASTSLEGDEYFYPNVLESVGRTWRQPWFNCACCPPNIARLFASLQGYIYATSGDRLYVNLYASNEAAIDLGGKKVRVVQETNYPCEGAIRIAVEPERDGEEFEISVRIPAWATGKPGATDLYRYADELESGATLAVNGEAVAVTPDKGYVTIRRAWKKGDAVELNLPMQVHRVLANDKVEEDRGRVAIERGPVVFCVESADVVDGNVRNLLLGDDAELTTEFDPELLNGVQVVRGRATAYEYVGDGEMQKAEQEFTAIPYYAWCNRGFGEMQVWLAREESAVVPLNAPSIAAKSTMTSSAENNLEAVNDGVMPSSSNDSSCPVLTLQAERDGRAWVLYELDQPTDVSLIEIYWCDKGEGSDCRLPRSWQVLYKKGEHWAPAFSFGPWSVEKDKFCVVGTEAALTSSVLLEVVPQHGCSVGIYEWKLK